MKRKLKISKKDVRVGNFAFHAESDFVKVYDINNIMSHRISTLTPKGKILAMALEDRDANERWLMNYVAVMFNVLSCVPDPEFFADLNRAAEACLSRHKDLYGIKEDISEEEDAAILDGERNFQKAMDEFAKEGQE